MNSTSTPFILLRKGREKSLKRRHRWIFSGAVQNVPTDIPNGATVEIKSATGEKLGWGSYSPNSQIRVRMWSFDISEKINTVFFKKQLKTAIHARHLIFGDKDINGYRIVNAEADGLPGLIVDRYQNYLSCQFLSAGAEYWKETIVSCLNELLQESGIVGIYERSDASVRRKEGLKPTTGVLSGETPPEFVEISEFGLKLLVNIRNGHKTGFYLDQRDSRQQLTNFSAGKEVLNCFSYTGGFGCRALQGGAAAVVNIDTSAPALAIATQNAQLNGLDLSRLTNIQKDVFTVLRDYRDANKQFDVIVLDPPKFAESAAQVQKAARGYKDINMLAMKLLKPGGVLFTFSCSGHISAELFQKIVADAALDAGRVAQIINYLNQGPDHPIELSFPESAYLKGFICRVW